MVIPTIARLEQRPILFSEIRWNLKKKVENACTQAQTNQKRRNAKIRTFVGK
jgi:hypothetical protein